MSSFAFKRKARPVKIDLGDEDEANQDDNMPTIKPNRKPTKSTIRKPLDISDQNEESGPAVIKPKAKRKPKISHISIGLDTNDADESPVITPKKSSKSENVSLRKNIAIKDLPMRSADGDREANIYSKEYLAELQSAHRSAPKDLKNEPGDKIELDMEELEGAMIVETSDAQVLSTTLQNEPRILSEAEIRERKDRRARAANEVPKEDIICLDDLDGGDVSMLSRLSRRTKEPETRLVREDEDFGEGFDDYVEDGGIALGQKAEREAKKRQKKEIEEMINEAQESSSGEDDDRRRAFEVTQSRKAGAKTVDSGDMEMQVPGRIAAIPEVVGCTERMKEKLVEMRKALAKRRLRVAELREELDEVAKREVEVQSLLDEAGKEVEEVLRGAGQHMKQIEGGNSEFVGERGLESLGGENNDGDVEMQM